MFNTKGFNGKITYQVIESLKISKDKTIRIVTIADLHNYTDSRKRSTKLADTIERLQPDIVFIAGDIFNSGKFWLGGKELDNFKYFLSLVAKYCFICLTLGNHDLVGIKNNEQLLYNFYNLKKIKSKYVFPLYNDKVHIMGVDIIGYVPSSNLMNGPGLQTQIHGLAHDEFIKEYNKIGVKFNNKKNLNIFLVHDPHLIAISENNIGLEKLSICDYFITGHLHNGYKLLYRIINNLKFRFTGKELSIFNYDKGLAEQIFGVADKDGKIIRGSRKILGSTGLCRGIVYFDDNAQQKLWQSPNNLFYLNTELANNRQNWNFIDEEFGRKKIISDKLHSMLISEGVSPIFIAKEKHVTINVVDIKKYTRLNK